MQKADHETAKKPEPSIAVHAGQTSDREPCSDCPWRIANHGRRHPGGFFRKDNLRRLWNQIRKGGGMQTWSEHVETALLPPLGVPPVLRSRHPVGDPGQWVFTRRIEDCTKPQAPRVSQAARVETITGHGFNSRHLHHCRGGGRVSTAVR